MESGDEDDRGLGNGEVLDLGEYSEEVDDEEEDDDSMPAQPQQQ